MSATKKSSVPSRFTSAKSIPIEYMQLWRIENHEAARKTPFPSLSQTRSGDSKSLQTYKSGAPSPSKSRNMQDNPQSLGMLSMGFPFSSRKTASGFSSVN